jgi:hypothetical protein
MADTGPFERTDTVDFDDPILMRPTFLERVVGHELDDESAAFIYAAMRAFGVDLGQKSACGADETDAADLSQAIDDVDKQ